MRRLFLTTAFVLTATCFAQEDLNNLKPSVVRAQLKMPKDTLKKLALAELAQKKGSSTLPLVVDQGTMPLKDIGPVNVKRVGRVFKVKTGWHFKFPEGLVPFSISTPIDEIIEEKLNPLQPELVHRLTLNSMELGIQGRTISCEMKVNYYIEARATFAGRGLLPMAPPVTGNAKIRVQRELVEGPNGQIALRGDEPKVDFEGGTIQVPFVPLDPVMLLGIKGLEAIAQGVLNDKIPGVLDLSSHLAKMTQPLALDDDEKSFVVLNTKEIALGGARTQGNETVMDVAVTFEPDIFLGDKPEVDPNTALPQIRLVDKLPEATPLVTDIEATENFVEEVMHKELVDIESGASKINAPQFETLQALLHNLDLDRLDLASMRDAGKHGLKVNCPGKTPSDPGFEISAQLKPSGEKLSLGSVKARAFNDEGEVLPFHPVAMVIAFKLATEKIPLPGADRLQHALDSIKGVSFKMNGLQISDFQVAENGAIKVRTVAQPSVGVIQLDQLQ